MSPHFAGRNRLRKVYLKKSRVSAIENQTFVGLTDLRLLDLSHNELTQLYGWEFRGLEESLRELYLQHNQLVSIAEETFKVRLHSSGLESRHITSIKNCGVIGHL